MTDLAAILGPEGDLARSFAGYEHRPPQIEMASAVGEVISSEGVLLAEAGTGTGKTLAYLLPAVLSGKRTIISTGTRNLQDQIFFKDLPLLSETLGLRFTASYLKGQENYLCLRRFEEFLGSPLSLDVSEERLHHLCRWKETTLTGDRSELADLPDDDPLWRDITSTLETRLGARCPHHETCFVTRARAAAGRSDLVVVNHHLYFADLASRANGGTGILGDHEVLILDEAHLIEDIATEFFSIVVSSGGLESILRDIRKSLRAGRGSALAGASRLDGVLEHVAVAAGVFFSRLRDRETGRRRLSREDVPSLMEASYHPFDAALEALAAGLDAMPEASESIRNSAERASRLRSDLAEVLSLERKGHVHWVETRRRSVSIGASPIDVSGILREQVFFRVPSVVLTSATLTAGKEFTYLKSRLGLDFPVKELRLDSPFDYPSQAVLFCPRDMPDPRTADAITAVAEQASRLIALTNGGALLLFTSFRVMDAVHPLLKERLDRPVSIQGEKPKHLLLQDLARSGDGVLLATASFWQGVDIPGPALRLVIIDKLPFSPPDDPLLAARCERIREEGAEPFQVHQLPRAALALKQGFGRLIRTRQDRGIVAVLDPRLLRSSYGRFFLSTLPACPVLTDFEAVRDWWTGSITSLRPP